MMLSQIKPLTQEQRQNAHDAAQQAVIRAVGERPLLDMTQRYNVPLIEEKGVKSPVKAIKHHTQSGLSCGTCGWFDRHLAIHNDAKDTA